MPNVRNWWGIDKEKAMQKRKLVQALAAWGALVLFLLITRPEHLPVGVLIVPFLLLGLAVYLTWLSLVDVFLPKYRDKKTAHAILGGIIASTLVICLGLQSIGELALQDIIPVLLFVSLVYFYIARNSRQA